MAEYIEREAFLGDIEKRYCLPCKEEGKDYNGCMCRAYWVDDMQGNVIGAPAADVAPVVHGRWIEQEKYTFGVMYDCSICGNRILDTGHSWNYCPNCGARMDGDDDAKEN